MTRAKATSSKTSKAKAKPAAKPASKSKAKAGAKAKAKSGTTRTASRSAKRRSPKAPEEDGELLEYERLQFLKAMDAYKRATNQTFPSWTEVLDVIRSIGWMSPARLSALKDKQAA